MPKHKCRNTRNMNNEENDSPRGTQQTSMLEHMDEQTDKIPEKGYKRVIARLLKNTEKQILN